MTGPVWCRPMRRGLALFVLLVFLPLPGFAQEAPALGEPQRVLEDPAGDYYAQLRDGPGIYDPIPYYEFMDMEWLEVTETEDGFTFTIKVVDIEGPLDETVGFSDGGFFWIHFKHNDWDYQLQIERPSGQLEIEFFAVLQGKYEAAEEWGFLYRDDEGVTFDHETDTITYTVPRDDLPDSRGAAPYPGRSLSEFWVLASQRSSRAEADFNDQTLQFPWQLQDRMPDTGVGDTAVNVQAGLAQTGHARLLSDEPYRASNGEATTFLYTVTARNDGDQADLFTLEAVGAPPGWDVQVPLSGVELEPGEELAVPVLASTPFNHQHGGTAEFVLEMRSTTDPTAVGRVELGVRYLTIPQPAGHHETVFLHSIANTQTASFNSAFAAAFQPSGSAYFNTLTEDPSSDEVAVSAFAGLGPADFTWLIPLDPTLRMGLDFDLERLGEALFEITSPAPMQDASLDGAFVLREAGSGFQSFQDATVLASFAQDGLSWGPDETKAFGLEIAPDAAGDYIPYNASNELWLVIELTGTGVSAFNQNTVPRIEPGGSFQLPLIDYEDDISDAFDALSGARMATARPAIRDANPGDVVLFDVALTARDAAAGDYDLELTGTHTEWARLVTADTVSVGGANASATVLVEVPDAAADGDRAELFLEAVHQDDTQRRGLVRLVVDVDTDAEHDDDRAAAAPYLDTQEQDTPLGILLSLAGLGLGALWVRRR